MFSWGGCLIKLLISIGVAFGTTQNQDNVGYRIFFAVVIYGVISAWWYCCVLMGNYLIGTVLFIAAVFFSTWGITSAPNMVVRVIAYIVIFLLFLGGIIADIKGIVQAIRNR